MSQISYLVWVPTDDVSLYMLMVRNAIIRNYTHQYIQWPLIILSVFLNIILNFLVFFLLFCVILKNLATYNWYRNTNLRLRFIICYLSRFHVPLPLYHCIVYLTIGSAIHHHIIPDLHRFSISSYYNVKRTQKKRKKHNIIIICYMV